MNRKYSAKASTFVLALTCLGLPRLGLAQPSAPDEGADGSATERKDGGQPAAPDEGSKEPAPDGDEEKHDSAPEEVPEDSSSNSEEESSDEAAPPSEADSDVVPDESTLESESEKSSTSEKPDNPAASEAHPENKKAPQSTTVAEKAPDSSRSAEALSSDGLQDIDLLSLLEIDVSTATKTSESLDEAPAVITAVTAEDIRRWGYTSVGEVLQHIVGFYMIDDHITPNVAVRGVSGGLGAESSVIKVMIDGRSVAFRTTNGNWLGVELIPLSAIKQIEVIRGPASALYGADAFLGVVNIITIAPEDTSLIDATIRGGVVGENPAGSFDITSGIWGESFDFMLTAAGELSDRSGLEMPEESPAPRIPSYNAGETTSQDLSRKSLVVGGRGGYTDSTHGHHVNFSAFASGINRGGDFAQWAQLTAGVDDLGRDVGTVVSLGQFRINADGLYQVNDKLGIALQSTYFQGGNLSDDRIEVGSDLYYVDRTMAYRGVDTTLEARLALHERFNMIAGVETLYDHEALPTIRRINKEDNLLLGDEPEEDSVDLLNLAGFMSANLRVIKRWLKLTGGLRYDHHNRYGGQFSGRAGATSRLSDSMVAKLLYGNAFKAPSPYLLFAKPLSPGDVVGNEDLKPQYIDTWEAQFSWKPLRAFSASTGVSYSIVRDKAEFIPQGINQAAQNVANQTSLTWESRIDAKKGDLYGGYASFEIAHSQRDLEDHGYQADLVGSDMIIYPSWTGRIGTFVAFPTPRKYPLELSSQAIIVGPRRAADASILENGGSFSLDPYLNWNASLRLHDARLFKNQLTSVALRVKNILGNTGPDPGFSAFEYPLKARSLYLELRHRY